MEILYAGSSVFDNMAKRVSRHKTRCLDICYTYLSMVKSPRTVDEIKQHLRSEIRNAPTTYQLSAWIMRDNRFKERGLESPKLWVVR